MEFEVITFLRRLSPDAVKKFGGDSRFINVKSDGYKFVLPELPDHPLAVCRTLIVSPGAVKYGTRWSVAYIRTGGKVCARAYRSQSEAIDAVEDKVDELRRIFSDPSIIIKSLAKLHSAITIEASYDT